MDERFKRKYQKILEILPDVAECTKEELILVGGTALAVFYLKHRASVDLDFVPIGIDDCKAKQNLKGALSKMNYTTLRTEYSNQFAIRFEETTIKVEIFIPEDMVVKKPVSFNVQGREILVASLEDLTEMKIRTYARRKQARDLFDIYMIYESKGNGAEITGQLLKKYGKPEGLDELQNMVFDAGVLLKFLKVIKDAS
jgi:predicted nucleotidyltransferase component of viral defense system